MSEPLSQTSSALALNPQPSPLPAHLWGFGKVVCSLVWNGTHATIAGLAGWPDIHVNLAYQRFSHTLLNGCGSQVVEVQWEAPPESLPSPMVMVSNHASNLDGPLINIALPQRSIRYVVKAELLKVPILGRSLVSSGCVPIHRQERGKGREALAATTTKSTDLLFFAEGTRTKDGHLQPFKKGAFHHALQHGLPILPIGLGGTFAVLPPGAARARPGPLAVSVGAPIAAEGELSALMARTWAEVARLRGEAEASCAGARR